MEECLYKVSVYEDVDFQTNLVTYNSVTYTEIHESGRINLVGKSGRSVSLPAHFIVVFEKEEN